MKNNSVGSSAFANLDLLRAVAVGLVFFCHLITIIKARHVAFAEQLGHVGVLTFFVHTSLVLMWSGERDMSQTVGKRWFTAFYVKRAFRIYPLSMLCVVIAYFSRRLLNMHPGSVSNFLANLSLTQNLFQGDNLFTVIWTLPLEVQMYLVLPLLLVFLKGRTVGWTVATVALSVPIALLQIRTSPRLEVLGYAPVFLGGVLGWRLIAQQKEQLGTKTLPGYLWPVSFCASMGLWILVVLNAGTNPAYGWIFGWVLGITIPKFKEVKWGWLKFASKKVATYSYGIYLCHQPIQEVCIGHLPGPMVVRLLACVTLTLAVAVALYYLIEAPGIAWGKKLEQRLLLRNQVYSLDLPLIPFG